MLKIYMTDHLPAFTEEETEKLLRAMPDERRKKALSYRFLKDRYLCIEAYRLLHEGLKADFCISSYPRFDYTDRGKPMLRDYNGIHFSLSHCDRGVACAISDREVGIDMETIQNDVDHDLYRLCLSGEETEKVKCADNPALEFTSLWTKKEAYLKLTGEGLTDNLPALFTPKILRNTTFSTMEYPQQGFVVTVCTFKY